MLINAQKPEEVRIAIITDSELEDFQIESTEEGTNRGNIYRGIVASIQPNLNAAFIDYGQEKHGFLSVQDVVEQAWHHGSSGGRRARIDQILERGKPILVQVSKDAEGQKGAGLTTNLSLAGRYLVLTPYDDTRGVSRKVEDDELRQKLRDQAAKLKIPPGGGFIIRTNAIDQNKTSLSRDFTALMRVWKQIEKESKKGRGPSLLYSDQDLITKSLRDYFDNSISEVLIDEPEAFARAEEYVKAFLPRSRSKLKLYRERVPLFAKFALDVQIERILDRKVALASGGSIVIDRTEALVAIDVNSGKFKGGGNQEEMAVRTNLEAAKEVARQLRLRDIGGLIVVDFIDMRSRKYQNSVEKTLRDALKTDKARSTVGKISPNGLLEINRQRIRQALHLRTHRACPTCEGTGRIASPELVGMNLLRRIEAQASTRPVRKVRIELHPELADAFQNSRRREIAAIEEEFDIQIEVIASSSLHRPEQEIEWIEGDAPRAELAARAPDAGSNLPAPSRSETNRHEIVTTGESEGRKSRRRRRRRRRSGEQSENGTGQAGPVEEKMLEAVSEVPDVAAVPDRGTAAVGGQPAAAAEGGETKQPRKRRRRKRKGGGDGVTREKAPEVAAEPRQPGRPVSPDLELPAWEWDGETAAMLDEGARTESQPAAEHGNAAKKKRRRRRRASGAKSDVALAGSSETGGSHELPAGSGDGGPVEPPAAGVSEETAKPAKPPARRPRRRPRAKPHGKTPSAAADSTPADAE